MIFGFIGDIGQGKTCSMIAYAYTMFRKGYQVFSNIKLNFPHQPLTIQVIMDYYDSDIRFEKPTIFILDEAHMVLDSRSSMSARSKFISYMVLQTRKRGIMMLYTTQHYHQVEKRLRASTDAFVECYFKKKNGQNYILNVFNIVRHNSIKTKKIAFNPTPIFKLYNTYEVVRPI